MEAKATSQSTDFARVGRHATEDGGHGRFGGRSGLAVGLAGRQRGHEIVHLGLVALDRTLPALRLLAVDLKRGGALQADGALGALGELGEAVPAAGDLPAEAEHARAVGEEVFHGMVIVDLADARRSGPAGRPTPGPDRMALLDPVADVDVVNVLLDVVVAAQPGEMIPVLHLVLHFGLARLAGPVPDARGVEVDRQVLHVADGAVVDALDRFPVAGQVPEVMADGHGQLLLLRLLAGGKDLADAGGIDGDRLLHEHVLAGLHGGLELGGPEAGRGDSSTRSTPQARACW